jgi:hypothetical protein
VGGACSEGTTEVTQHMEIQEQSTLFCEEEERGAKKTTGKEGDRSRAMGEISSHDISMLDRG